MSHKEQQTPEPEKRQRLRWKKQPKELGLRAVGAGPRSSDYTDGRIKYAEVNPHGGSWVRPLVGWYWVAGWGSGVPYKNTCNLAAPDEATAKKQAEAWVKAHLSANAQVQGRICRSEAKANTSTAAPC